ncbi:hypothetical protein VNO77_33650 [Canavalia gladiata]|uniref:Uncharacterized protein n=1 Tax=Canavalia gladiata TaxID=3824 RepID=A0AAN9KF37_CANGL
MVLDSAIWSNTASDTTQFRVRPTLNNHDVSPCQKSDNLEFPFAQNFFTFFPYPPAFSSDPTNSIVTRNPFLPVQPHLR